jgi:hypothetical protein
MGKRFSNKSYDDDYTDGEDVRDRRYKDQLIERRKLKRMKNAFRTGSGSEYDDREDDFG